MNKESLVGAALTSVDVVPRKRRARRGPISAVARSPLALVGIGWIVMLLVLTIAAPAVASYSPTAQTLSDALSGPSAAHILGTDQLGRDIFARLIFGAQVSLLSVAIATVVAVSIGSLLGLVAGYFGSGADSALSGIADVLMSIPSIIILLSVSAVVARNQAVLMIVLGLLVSASVFRVIRAATLDVRNELYITAAKTSGLSNGQIIGRHILPRLGGLIVVQAAIVASLATVTQVGLGFLGIDVVQPAPSWGSLMLDASTNISTDFWQVIPPTVVVMITVLSFSVIGDVVQRSLTGRGRHGGLGGRVTHTGALDSDPEVELDGALSSSVSNRHLLSARDMSIVVPSDSGPLTLVDRVSFEINAGEVVALVGESGAGKSVTARALLGLLPAGAQTSGSLLFDNMNILGSSESVLARIRGTEVAFVSQEPMGSLSPAFTVGAQLAEIVRANRHVSRPEAHRIALELLTTVEIPMPEEVAKKCPHQLSGGMAQRVVIAIALAGEPKLLVADEPTTALDVSVQMQILGLLRTLQKTRGLAVLFVTHDWGVVADLCDRAVVLYAGQVVEQTDVTTIFSAPRHPYTAALRAADPHLQVRHERLATIPGQVPAPDAWPSGCRFAARCSFARDECSAGPIPMVLVHGTHPVRCIRTDELGVLENV